MRLGDQIAVGVAQPVEITVLTVVDAQHAPARRSAERQVHPAAVFQDALVEFQGRRIVSINQSGDFAEELRLFRETLFVSFSNSRLDI